MCENVRNCTIYDCLTLIRPSFVQNWPFKREKRFPALGFELGTSGTQIQSSTIEPQNDLMKIAEILEVRNNVTFGPPDFPIRVPYFIYHSALKGYFMLKHTERGTQNRTLIILWSKMAFF